MAQKICKASKVRGKSAILVLRGLKGLKIIKLLYEVNKGENWYMYKRGEYKKDGGYRL